MNIKLRNILYCSIVILLFGCATPSEIRQSGFNRTVVVPGASESVVHCFAEKLDNAARSLTHLVRKDAVQYSVVSRNAEQAVSVVDFRDIGTTVEAKIYVGPAVIRKDGLSDTYEVALKECAAGK